MTMSRGQIFPELEEFLERNKHDSVKGRIIQYHVTLVPCNAVPAGMSGSVVSDQDSLIWNDKVAMSQVYAEDLVSLVFDEEFGEIFHMSLNIGLFSIRGEPVVATYVSYG